MRKGVIAAGVLLAVAHAAAAQDGSVQNVIDHRQFHYAMASGEPAMGRHLLFPRGDVFLNGFDAFDAVDAVDTVEGFATMPASLSPLRRSAQPRIRLSVATAGGEPGLSLNYSAPLGHQRGFFAAIVTTGKQSIARVGIGFRW